MKHVCAALAGVALRVAVSAAQEFDVDEFLAGPAPHSITNAGFDAVVDQRDFVAVNFCDETSVVCTNFAEKWNGLSSELPDVVFLTVDISVETELSERFQAFESPTLVFFAFSQPENHDAAAFDAESMVAWITEQKHDVVRDSPPSLEPVPGMSSFTLYARQRMRKWLSLARRYRLMGDFHFQQLKEDSKEEDRIVVRHFKEEDYVVSTDDWEAATTNISQRFMPLWGLLDEVSLERYASYEQAKLVWIMPDMKKTNLEDFAESVRDEFTELAQEYRATHLFAYIDSLLYRDALQELLRVDTFPAVSITLGITSEKPDHKWSSGDVPLRADPVREFVQGVENGSIDEAFRSQKEPHSNQASVKTVVSKTIKDMCFKGRACMIMVHQPQDRLCKKFKPVIRAFGRAITDASLTNEILAVQFDATQNESPVPGLTWGQTLPVLYLSQPDGTLVKYDGEPSKTGLIAWTTKHFTHGDRFATALADAGHHEDDWEEPPKRRDWKGAFKNFPSEKWANVEL